MRKVSIATSLLVAATIALAFVPSSISDASRSFSAPKRVALETPGALAVSSTGVLYVIDAKRDQILERLPDGTFHVVAGNGHRGFSGDGHRAVKAEISVTEQSALAVSTIGTLYFTDQGSGRVREVLRNGDIRTVAGGGERTPGMAPVVAVEAKFGVLDPLNTLTVSPQGTLYIGANDVYTLTKGVLHWVVGSTSPRLNKGFRGYGLSPIVQKDFDPVLAVAVDGNGDLLVGGGGTWGLYERTSKGTLRFVQEDRAEGGLFAAMSSAPNGSVVIAGGAHGLSRFHPSGLMTSIKAWGLSNLLLPSHFTVGEGVATSRNGVIYVDADANNGFTSVSAIVRITPSGRVHLLWKS